MEEDVDDVDEEEKSKLNEDIQSNSRKLIIANYMKKIASENTANTYNNRIAEKNAEKKYKEQYKENQKQLKSEQKKQRKDIEKQKRENAQKQKREREQKQKREEAINKKRNDLKPFRSSLECRWNQECKFGCGYIHLDRATPSMKSNCCMNGKLSPLQANQFYERYGLLQPLSPGMQDLLINNIEHMGPLSSTYSNVLSIAAIGVENGNKATGVKNTHVGGFEIRGQGAPDCVTMYGRSFHYLTKATDSFHTIEKIGKLFNIFTSIIILIAVIL